MKKYATVETLKSTRIFMSAFTWFFLRTVPTSRNAKPACMASTRIAPMSIKNTSEPITDCMRFSSSNKFVVYSGSSHVTPPRQRTRQRAAISGLKFAPYGHPIGDARGADIAGMRQLADVVRSGFALDRQVGGENDFFHLPFVEQRLKTMDADLVRPDSIERRQPSHEHEIVSMVGTGLLDGRKMGRGPDHAQ